MTALKQQAPQSGIPLPEPTKISRPFWNGCQRGELLFQRCNDCGKPNFIPAAACRTCLSTSLTWERSKGEGAVYSWTVIWRPQTPAFEIPYAVAIIDMDEGYQMMSSLIDCNAEDIRLGLRVHVDFRQMSDEITLPYFTPTPAG